MRDSEADHSLRAIRQFFGPFTPKSALNFRCGAGCTIALLTQEISRVTWVDAGAPVPADRQFDFVISLFVLQSIPPKQGYNIISELWKAVAPGGGFNIQFTIYKDAAHRGAMTRDAMYDYDLSRVLSEIESTVPLHLENTNQGGYDGINLYARKP